MELITKKVDYNPDASEFYGSGEMLFFTPAITEPPLPALVHQCFLPARFATLAAAIRNFEVRSDDIWVISFPKAGNTWTSEMIWMLHRDMDYAGSNAVLLDERYRFLELSLLRSDTDNNSIEATAAAASPRFIKSHLPVNFLPLQLWTVKPKIIYTARNPKDTVISYYHYGRNYFGIRGVWDDFVEAFRNSKLTYAPFHSHVLGFWNMRNESNVMFLTYETMKEDLLSVIRRAAHFLGKSFTDEALEKLQKHLSFDAMRNNDRLNNTNRLRLAQQDLPKEFHDTEYRYMRKGEAGGFRADMPPALIVRFDEWNNTNLEGSGFQFAM